MARLLLLVVVFYVVTIARTKQLVPSDNAQSLATIVEGKDDTNHENSDPDEPHVTFNQHEIDTRLTALHEDVLKNDNLVVTMEKEGKELTDCSLKIADYIKLLWDLEERYKGEIEHYKNENDILKEYIHGLEKSLQDKVEAAIEVQHDCADILRKNPEAPSGGYTIYTTDVSRINGSMRVFCDMDTDGGGWTVFQRRIDGSVDFFRNYQSYIDGFGDVTGEFYLGNENLHLLTSRCDQDLRLDMMDDHNNRRYAQYATFHVGPDDDKYRVHFTTYSGTAGDSFTDHNNMRFSTYDRNNMNCAQTFEGAWWYTNCLASNLNGRYYTQSPPSVGVYWHHYRASGDDNLRFTEMKIRPSGECD